MDLGNEQRAILACVGWVEVITKILSMVLASALKNKQKND